MIEQKWQCPDCGAVDTHFDRCDFFPGEPVVHGNRLFSLPEIKAREYLRAILSTPEGRAEIKALLTEDGPVQAAFDVIEEDVQAGASIESVLELAQDALGAAVDALADAIPSEEKEKTHG